MSKLVSIAAAPTPRPGTARHAAFHALKGCMGKSKHEALEAVDKAEADWHRKNNRDVIKRNPSGWLKLFNAKFA